MIPLESFAPPRTTREIYLTGAVLSSLSPDVIFPELKLLMDTKYLARLSMYVCVGVEIG